MFRSWKNAKKSLEKLLEAGNQGADEDPRVGEVALEPAGLGGAGDCRGGLDGIERVLQGTADRFDRAIESLLACGGRANEIFESCVHTISLLFLVLGVKFSNKRGPLQYYLLIFSYEKLSKRGAGAPGTGAF